MKIVAGMATIACREVSLKNSIESLVKQVDILHVYLNDYSEIPVWLRELSEGGVVYPLLGSDDRGDLGDCGKFRFVEKYNSTDTYFFSVDDDIIYPNTYVQHTIAQSKKYEGCGIFTYHGRFFVNPKLPIEGYFRTQQGVVSFYHFAAEVAFDTYVHFGGTGVMCINLSKIQIPFDLFSKERNMADIFIGVFAQKIKASIILLAHPRMWIEPSVLIGINDSIFGATYNVDSPKNVINRELVGVQTALNTYTVKR